MVLFNKQENEDNEHIKKEEQYVKKLEDIENNLKMKKFI
jgi:hypothetical protein